MSLTAVQARACISQLQRRKGLCVGNLLSYILPPGDILLIPSIVSLGTVLLHLVAASIGHRACADVPSSPLAAVYIPVPSPFPQLERFIDDAASAYDLDLFHCPQPSNFVLPVETVPTPGAASAPIPERAKHVKGGEGMRLALELYKNRFPHVEAILIGTRRSDPHGGAYHLAMHA